MLQLQFAVREEARTSAVLFGLQERALSSLPLLQPEVMPLPRNPYCRGKCNFCSFPAADSPSSFMLTAAVFACTGADLVAPLISLDFFLQLMCGGPLVCSRAGPPGPAKFLLPWLEAIPLLFWVPTRHVSGLVRESKCSFVAPHILKVLAWWLLLKCLRQKYTFPV